MIVSGEADDSDVEDVKTEGEADRPSRGTGVNAGVAKQAKSKFMRRGSSPARFFSLRQASTEQFSSPSSSSHCPLRAGLVSSNTGLRDASEAFCVRHVDGAAEKARALLADMARTQVFFQDAVLSMQQASHFCAEAVESSEDFMQNVKMFKFPT